MSCSEPADTPRHEKILLTKYALQRKRDATRIISKYKARFVGCGNEGQNEDKPFSPVAEFTVVKFILCLAAQSKSKVRHYDFQNAFPNEILVRPVYAYSPRHFSNEMKYWTKALKIQRSLYGRKDAVKIWYDRYRHISKRMVFWKWKAHDVSSTRKKWWLFATLTIFHIP